MKSTKSWRWLVLPVTAITLLTFGSQSGKPQAPPPQIDPPIGIPHVLTPPVPPAPPGVDALLDQLEQLRKQKAELEAREKAVIEQLHGRLKNQSDRLQKLGVVAPTVPSPAAKEDIKFLDVVIPPLPDSKTADFTTPSRPKK